MQAGLMVALIQKELDKVSAMEAAGTGGQG
jgi:hypothetical protein